MRFHVRAGRCLLPTERNSSLITEQCDCTANIDPKLSRSPHNHQLLGFLNKQHVRKYFSEIQWQHHRRTFVLTWMSPEMLRCVACACPFMICVKMKRFVSAKASPRTLDRRKLRSFRHLWMYVSTSRRYIWVRVSSIYKCETPVSFPYSKKLCREWIIIYHGHMVLRLVSHKYPYDSHIPASRWRNHDDVQPICYFFDLEDRISYLTW